jgi:hypothetical protein
VYQILLDFVPIRVEGINKTRIASAVPDEFLEASPCCVGGGRDCDADVDRARSGQGAARDYPNLRFEPLAAAAETLARDARYNMFRERWEVVQQALQVYSLAKSFTRYAQGLTRCTRPRHGEASGARAARRRRSATGQTRPRRREEGNAHILASSLQNLRVFA